ncbi:ATP-dependent DNA ligase [Vallicoccus soli]|uniref:Probable DNA ligase n=1 Tax=Vallicoccus soli TaxID=2339232 RepID=A0A3A3YZH9_9ACTN|nr:ATP-dependent DNA ligase [Vallicoccus soli]RJK96293.1 ATP-dependent DNA ligase [Vallicoccus soli]
MLLDDLAAASDALAATTSRLRKVEVLADVLRRAALDEPDEVGLAVAWLSGSLRQRRTGLGPAALRDLPPPADAPSLRLPEVDAAFERAAREAGPGSGARRLEGFRALVARATAREQRLLAGLVVGEVRHGALGGVALDAVARAAGLPGADVRRAAMLGGALGPVAQAALADGAAGLARFRLRVGRPLQPMLAQAADDVGGALARTGPARVEEKLDGVRVQVHRDGGAVLVVTRSLDDVTARLPEVVAAVRGLDVGSAVLDGEVLALGPDGRPLPFQLTASRVGRHDGDAAVPLSVRFFDVLHLDGDDLVAEPARERQAALERAVPAALRVRAREVDGVDGVEEAQAFLDAALARGHEGVVVKALGAPYEAGRRGAAWVKVKPRHTLDLVVLAAEWGHGRRRGTLSNLHLGARDDHAPTGFTMLGKTFKGLTDAMLSWQTERLLALEAGREGHVVRVRPELVVEVAFDGVQTSPRYPGGVALRFARVLRHRPDKRAEDADGIAAVRAIHARPGEG